MFKYKKRGQISLDFIFAFLFLMLVSLFIVHIIFSYNDSMRNGIIADRLESIADTFENYAILSYTENEPIVFKLKPIGKVGYNISILNKTISVYADTNILFLPTKNGVKIAGLLDSSQNVGDNIVITANINGKVINISKKLDVNVSFE